MPRIRGKEGLKHIRGEFRKNTLSEPSDCKLELSPNQIIFNLKKQQNSASLFEVVGINKSRSQLEVSFADGTSICISEQPGSRNQEYAEYLLSNIINFWEKYFPSYDFCFDAIRVDGDDTLLLQSKHLSTSLAEKEIVQRSLHYSNKFSPRPMNVEDVFYLVNEAKDRYLKLSEYQYRFPGTTIEYLLCPLLSFPFFTVLDLSDDIKNTKLVDFCTIGLRTDKALRSLIVGNAQLKRENVCSILGSLPASSKLRNLSLSFSKESLISISIGSLKPQIFKRLISLCISGVDFPETMFKEFISKNVLLRHESLQLRQLDLSQTSITPTILQHFCEIASQLRVLHLNNCDLEISQVCKLLNTSKCERLEVLNLSGNKLNEDDLAIKAYFTSLRSLQVLILRSINGKNILDGLKHICSGLGKRQDPVYCRLEVDLDKCSLNFDVGKMIAIYLPRIRQLTSISLLENAFKDATVQIVRCLPSCCNLTQIALGTRKSSSPPGTLTELAQVLSISSCSVKRLMLGELGDNAEMCSFLEVIPSLGEGLTYLDISSYGLSDEESACIFRLLRRASSTVPFTLIFNISNFTDEAKKHLMQLLSYKWPLHKIFIPNRLFIAESGQATIVMTESETSKSITLPRTQLPLELGKFQDALITPSMDLSRAELELNQLELQLKKRFPRNNVEQIENVYPELREARMNLHECLQLPSMHVELLEAALNAERCNRAVNGTLKSLEDTLKKSLNAFCEESCECLKDIIHSKFRQSYVSVNKFSQDLSESAGNIASQLLNQNVESIRSLFLEMNTRMVEKMLLEIMNGLKDVLNASICHFPESIELKPADPIKSSGDEYVSFNSPQAPRIVGENEKPCGLSCQQRASLLAESNMMYQQIDTSLPRSTSLPNKPPSISSPDKVNSEHEEVSSSYPLQAVIIRPSRRRKHEAKTIIHTDVTEVIHGPVDTAGLFQTSRPLSEGDNEEIQEDTDDSSDGSSPKQPPLGVPPLGKNVFPGLPTITREVLKKQEGCLTRVTPVSPPTSPKSTDLDESVRSVALLRNRFESGGLTRISQPIPRQLPPSNKETEARPLPPLPERK